MSPRLPALGSGPFRVAVLPLALAGALACSGGSGDPPTDGSPPPAAFPALALQPASSTLAPGQSLQFNLAPSTSAALTWSVVPPSLGSIDAMGTFTASGQPGQGQVLAALQDGSERTASAQIQVLAAAPAATSNPHATLTSGAGQAAAQGQVQNRSVLGESVLTVTASDASGTIQNRAGFRPR